MAPGGPQPGAPLPGQPLLPPEQRDSVRLAGVSKTYGTGKEALIDVDLVIRQVASDLSTEDPPCGCL